LNEHQQAVQRAKINTTPETVNNTAAPQKTIFFSEQNTVTSSETEKKASLGEGEDKKQKPK
jgi:hypothetical protein